MESIAVCEAVVVDGNGKILILRRSEGDYRRANQWDLPGGHLDAGEALEAGLCRELREETGIECRPDEAKLVYAMTEPPGDGKSVTWLFFLVRVNAAEVTVSHEHQAYQWAGLDEAINMIEYERQTRALKYAREQHLI